MDAKIWNHSEYIEVTDPAQLTKAFNELLKESGFNVLNFTEHHFSPHGWTALWLLSESHLAIHTFPEHNKAYIEISSCMLPHYVKFLAKLKEMYG